MRILALAAMAAAAVQAQSFEAASIQPLKQADSPFHFTVLPNRLDVKNLSLAYLIMQAFDVPDYQVSGPEQALSHRFDLLATSGAQTTRAEIMTMLRNLLVERFHLQTHWEERTLPAYRMVVMPGRPLMKVSAVGYAAANSPMRDGAVTQFFGPMSMRQLAEMLTRALHKPVVDATSLDGYYTIDLKFAGDDYDATKDTGPPLATLPKAVEEQLGLKLVPGKESIKYLIVDHADAVPTEN